MTKNVWYALFFQKLFVFQIFEFPLEIGLCARCTFWEIFEHSGSSTFLGKKVWRELSFAQKVEVLWYFEDWGRWTFFFLLLPKRIKNRSFWVWRVFHHEIHFQILKRNVKKFVARNVGFLAFIVSLRYVPHILPYRASRSGNSLENQGHKQHWPSRLKLTFIHVGTNFHVDQCPFQKTLLITTFLDNSGAKNSYS